MSSFFATLGNFLGEISALAAALLWAVSSVLFRTLGKTIRPLELNLIKGVAGFTLLGLTSLLIGEKIAVIGFLPILILAISGAVGIGFGDTMFFESINRLGAQRALLLTILAPPLTVVFAWIFLGESLNLLSWIGIIITILGVIWVITEKKDNLSTNAKRFTWLGVFFGFLAALSQAVGAILSRWALTESTVSALQSALIRLLAGTLVLLIWILVRREKIGVWLSPRPNARLWIILSMVVLFGTYIAIWLQQIAFEFSKVGIAQTLLATSPLFILPLAALQKEKISLRSIIGVLLSLGGIVVLFIPG